MNIKSISSHCKQFQVVIFLSQATIVADIFHKLVAPLHLFFLVLRLCNGVNVPKITSAQLEHYLL